MNPDPTLIGPSAPELPYQAVAARLWGIIGGLRHAVAALGGRDRTAVPLVLLVWGRVGRLAARFAWLMAHLAAGTLPAPRARAVGARTGAPRAAYVRLPRGYAWLVQVLPEAAAFGCQLQAMLQEPEVKALQAACPRAARILRPLHKMLAIVAPGTPVRASRAKPVWWQAVPEVVAPAPGLFPPGRPPPCWSG